MIFAQNLKYLLQKHGLDVPRLAEKTGLTGTALYKLVKEETRSPSVYTVSTLANFFHVSVESIISIDLSMQSSDDSHILPFPLVPLIRWEDVIHWGHQKVTFLSKIPAYKEVSEQAFALKIDSSLYEPYFPEGNIIFVDPTVSAKHKGYVVVVSTKTLKTFFKQSLMDDEGNIYLQSITENANKIKIPDDERIVGRVIHVKYDL